ncbi:MFS transporter [Paenibacillus herberti]|uniref:MFS transporter n=1 Tax=Paenibacillus herberti TaxID=1619309 RepID=A0A229NUU5_9BACL|nr:MFS transporter [Paenibacillus herberti]OXM13505.1 MFS transporter [Paenibacillus herberti]
MMELFRNRAFTRLFFATVSSQLSSTIGAMAFAFYLLDRFSSQPAYASIAEMLYSAPTVLVFLFIGVFADRFDRKRIAENTGWIRAVLSILMLAALAANVWIPIVFLLLFLRSAVTKFYFPAESAMIQGLLREDQYVKAAGLNQSLNGVFTLFGTGLGALVYHSVGVLGAVTIDAIGFLITALLVRSVSVPVQVRLPNGPTSFSSLKMKSIWGDFRDGFHYIVSNKLLLSLISGFVLFGLIGGSFTMLPMLTMKYDLAPDKYPFFVSLYSVFLGAGFVVGSALGSKLVEKFKLYQILISSLFLTGFLILLLGFTSSPWAYLVLAFVTACILAPLNMAIGGWLPKLVEPHKMGRVSAWIDPVMMAGQTLMLGLIAWLYPSSFTLLGLYIFIAVLLFLTSLIYVLTLPRFARQEESAQGQTKQGVSLGA